MRVLLRTLVVAGLLLVAPIALADRLKVQVLDEQTRGASGTTVVVKDDKGKEVARGKTDQRGKVTLDVPAGSYTVEAERRDDKGTKDESDDVVEEGSNTTTVNGTTRVFVDIKVGGTDDEDDDSNRSFASDIGYTSPNLISYGPIDRLSGFPAIGFEAVVDDYCQLNPSNLPYAFDFAVPGSPDALGSDSQPNGSAQWNTTARRDAGAMYWPWQTGTDFDYDVYQALDNTININNDVDIDALVDAALNRLAGTPPGEEMGTVWTPPSDTVAGFLTGALLDAHWEIVGASGADGTVTAAEQADIDGLSKLFDYWNAENRSGPPPQVQLSSAARQAVEFALHDMYWILREEALADGKISGEEQADLDLLGQQADSFGLTAEDQQQSAAYEERRRYLNEYIDHGISTRNTPEMIAERAQTMVMWDAATKTWRNVLFTGQALNMVQQSFHRNREAGIRATIGIEITEARLRNPDLSDQDRKILEGILSKFKTMRETAALNIAEDLRLMMTGVVFDVAVLGAGRLVASAARFVFGRGGTQAGTQAAGAGGDDAAAGLRAAGDDLAAGADDVAGARQGPGQTQVIKSPIPEGFSPEEVLEARRLAHQYAKSFKGESGGIELAADELAKLEEGIFQRLLHAPRASQAPPPTPEELAKIDDFFRHEVYGQPRIGQSYGQGAGEGIPPTIPPGRLNPNADTVLNTGRLPGGANQGSGTYRGSGTPPGGGGNLAGESSAFFNRQQQIAQSLRNMGMDSRQAGFASQMAAETGLPVQTATAGVAAGRGVPASTLMRQLGVNQQQLRQMLVDFIQRTGRESADDAARMADHYLSGFAPAIAIPGLMQMAEDATGTSNVSYAPTSQPVKATSLTLVQGQLIRQAPPNVTLMLVAGNEPDPADGPGNDDGFDADPYIVTLNEEGQGWIPTLSLRYRFDDFDTYVGDTDTTAGRRTSENDRVGQILTGYSFGDVGMNLKASYQLDDAIEIDATPMDGRILHMANGQNPANVLHPALNLLTRDAFSVGGTQLAVLFYPQYMTQQVLDWVEASEGVELSEQDKCRIEAEIPDDPYFHSTNSWSQGYDDQWAIKRVGYTADAASAWNSIAANAQPVIVAVIDTGIDWNHADINWERIWKNEKEIASNDIDDDGNGYVDDLIGWDFTRDNNRPWDKGGHGTFVAGIIGASTNNGVGIAGVNPHARIMALKALNNFGQTRASYLTKAIVYAADNGARVINLSVSGETPTQAEQLAIDYARSKGAVVITAAGNEAVDVSDRAPAGLRDVITVASTDVANGRAAFSNWGPGVDLAAPGVDVLSLRARRTDIMRAVPGIEYAPRSSYVGGDTRYYRAGGTSFSAPIVAGTASLMLSNNPTLTNVQVERMLRQSAREIGIPGVDWYTGYGLHDARSALTIDPEFYVEARIDAVAVTMRDGQAYVRVTGSLGADKLKRAWIEIGSGEAPTSWKPVSRTIDSAVDRDVLDDLDASHFGGANQWTLKLVTEHRNGKTRESRFTLNLN